MEALKTEQQVKAALAARIGQLEASQQLPPPLSPGGTLDLSVQLAQERLRTADLQKVPSAKSIPPGESAHLFLSAPTKLFHREAL